MVRLKNCSLRTWVKKEREKLKPDAACEDQACQAAHKPGRPNVSFRWQSLPSSSSPGSSSCYTLKTFLKIPNTEPHPKIFCVDLVLQVVALAIDPTNCVIFPAVNTLSPADIVSCPRQLRNRDTCELFQKNIYQNIPKIKDIPKEYSPTNLLKGSTVRWNSQLLDGFENRVLETKE